MTWGTLPDTLDVTDTPDADAGDGRQPAQQPLGQAALVARDRGHRRHQLAPAHACIGGYRRSRRFAVHAPHFPQEAIVRRAHLVCRQLVEHRLAAVQRTEVRPEPLVRRADQEVRAQRLHIDGAVRRIRDRVDIAQRADGVRPRHHLAYRVDGAHGVGGVAHRDQPGARSDGGIKAVEVEGAIVGQDIHRAHGQAAVRRRGAPGRDVGLVIEGGDHDLVACRERGRDGAAEMEGQRGHVGPELDLVR